MSFLRMCILVFLSFGFSLSYADVKPPQPKKTQVQTGKKGRPVQRGRTVKKTGAARKNPQAAKVAPPRATQAAKPPAPVVPSSPVVTPAAPAKPLPAVVPKITPSAAAPSVTQKEQKLIVIDPGHGGYDLGARMSACDEKSLALSMALLTKKYLTDMGYRVILTRSRDVFLPLEKRVLIGNETKGKLFISIHCNAAKNPTAKGIEVFYYASADKFRSAASKKLATRILSKVIDRTGAENRGVKAGNFYVIRETKMPAILLEAGFMTNPEELHRLKDINYRDKIARGIVEGIHSFFKS